MIRKSAIKLLAAAIATAIAGTAMANTSLDAGSTGDLFLNIENTITNTSYLFDTGVSQAAFNGNASYSFNLSGDSALQTFLSADPTSDYYYSVASATLVGGGPTAVATDYITGNSNVVPVNTTNNSNGQADAAIRLFLNAANLVSTSSTNSVVLPVGEDWGQGSTEGVVSNQIYSVTIPAPYYGDATSLNTALAFYDVTGTSYTTFASTWDFSTSGDVLSYGPASPVPLPTPVLLLLSGLGLMGAVARRAKLAA